MNFKNIEIQIPMSELTDLQKLHLETAEQFISNMFSVSAVKIPKNKFSYDGETFTIINVHAGYLHSFLTKDIHQTIQDNEEEHVKFIQNYVKQQFSDFSRQVIKRKSDVDELEVRLNTIIEYYKLNTTNLLFPKYLSSENFIDYISDLGTKINQSVFSLRQ